MWYIITIESYDFLSVTCKQDEVNFKFEGKQDGKPVFAASKGINIYSLEIHDKTFEPYYLTELNQLNPIGFFYLNHAAVLLNWNEDLEKLHSSLKSILNRRDKYAVLQISEIIASNFLPIELLNQMILK